jgi:DNA-binding NtrC family response regulator
LYLPYITELSTSQMQLALVHRGSGELIVLVDDETDQVAAFGGLFRRWGYNVEGFTESERAIAYVNANRERVRLFVTDYIMPELDGISLGRRILAEFGVPVVIMTGKSNSLTSKEVRRYRLSGYFHKLESDAAISSLLSRILRSAEVRRPMRSC